MKRTTILGLATALLAVGCMDLGLQGNIPEEEAETASLPELVAAVTAPAEDTHVVVDGREWVPSGGPMAVRLEELSPVGSAMGRTVYARAWDDEPYDELFTRLDEPADPLEIDPKEWRRYVPVLGGGGSGRDPGGGADHAPAGDAAH
jgi:hypothetical protein